MSLYDDTRAEKLILLARERFDPGITAAELRVLRDSTGSLDLPIPPEDAPRPEVRASFLRWLATDSEAQTHIDAKGLRVFSATITGMLDLDECRKLPSLWLVRCTIQGQIGLLSAESNGLYFLYCTASAKIKADRVVVHGPAQFRGLSASGVIRLLGAEIKGQLVFSGAHLADKNDALVLDGARIGGDVFLNEGFECLGKIRLLGAEIKGELNFMTAKVGMVACDNLQLGGGLMWQAVQKSGDTWLDLVGARVNQLRDDKTSWPVPGQLLLDGLVYEALNLHGTPTEDQIKGGFYGKELPLKVKERIAWLRLQSPKRCLEPQPWMQLARLLETKGDKAGAKHVLYEFHCLQAQQSWWLLRLMRVAFAWLEEAPWRIVYSIALTLLLGTLIFAGAGPGRSGAMIPTARDGAGQPLSGAALAHYPRFQPFVYTLENALPLVKLGMDDKWAPDPDHVSQAWFDSYGFLTVCRWLLILSGWFQATVLAAALANRFKP